MARLSDVDVRDVVDAQEQGIYNPADFRPAEDDAPPLPEDLGFDPEGSGYDESGARAAGLQPDETGHWPSRDPKTGMLFKGRGHETWPLTEQGEAEAGMTIVQNPEDKRYYSTKNPADFAPAEDETPSENPYDYIPATDETPSESTGGKVPFLTNVATSADKAHAAGHPVYYIAGAGKGDEARAKGYHYVHEESPRDTAEREQMIAQREGKAAPGGKNGERPWESFKKIMVQKMGYDPEKLDPGAEYQKAKQAYLDSQFGGKPFYEIDAMSADQINKIHKEAEKEGKAAEMRAKAKRVAGMKMLLDGEKRFESEHRRMEDQQRRDAEKKEARAYEEDKYRTRKEEERQFNEKRRIQDQDYRDHTAKEKAAMVNDTDRIRVLEKTDKLIKDNNIGEGEAIPPEVLKRINDMRADANLPELKERKVNAERTFMGIPYGEAEKEGWIKYEEETKEEEAARLKELARQKKLTEKQFRAYLNRVGTVGRAQHMLITAYKAKGLLQ